jgi:uncharacterized protein
VPEWMSYVAVFVFGPLPVFGLTVLGFYLYYRWKYIDWVVRVFEEKPFFIIPRGTPAEGAEDVRVSTTDGLVLRGCYLKTNAGFRRGVVLFGLEFGSNRWACRQYCERLQDAGYDVFACELRNQGESDKDPTYEPMQWSTNKDLADARAALAYLHARPDADPAGVGVFGISKGGSLGLMLAAEDRRVRCIATDGAFATYTTVVPFMRKFVAIIIKRRERIRKMIPDWFYGLIGSAAMNRSERTRGVKLVEVEKSVRKLRQPLLMIQGSNDTYITPAITEALFAEAKKAKVKELWVVAGAKHNQALNVAGDEYHSKLVAFFDEHLGRYNPLPAPASAADLVLPEENAVAIRA